MDECRHSIETDNRCRETSVAAARFALMFADGVPKDVQVHVFSCHMSSGGRSALEAFVLADKDYTRLDAALARPSGRCLRGRAYKRVTLVDVEPVCMHDKIANRTNKQVSEC